jgi:hypothetical protein
VIVGDEQHAYVACARPRQLHTYRHAVGQKATGV